MPTSVTVTKGDTLLPLNSIITIDGNPADLSLYTCKVFMVNAKDAADIVVNNLTTGVTAHPTQTFTVDTSLYLIKCRAHGVKPDQQVIVATAGTLPTGLTAATPYFAVNVTPNAFQVATLPGGSAIAITGAGTSTHTFYVVGSIQYDLQTTDVDAAGDYNFHFTLWSGSERATVPADGDTFTVHIVAPLGT